MHALWLHTLRAELEVLQEVLGLGLGLELGPADRVYSDR